ncbi:MCE family protein [Pelagibius litoralis]|uniref:MCE family protein n=1 Tax=Pelagibius litoralis TaxID=374515 RepID=A0A967EV53_9PROT|nr:MlaD family protein [Pelagibius litoralis]NIA68166.1 MCE family protein [Pelagibius litoralis]
METRANYIMVGLFVLLLAFGLLGFVLWLAKFQFDTDFARYDIIFESAVTGVKEGSPVRYNGVRVGEVISVDLDDDRPTAIRVRIEVEKRTPVRSDSEAVLELEGLTGGRYVLLTGGSPDAPPLEPPPGQTYAEIPPGTSSFEQVLEGAPEVLDNVNLLLRRAQALLSDRNLKNIEGLIANLGAVTGAIAKNSGNIDSLIADASATMENLRDATGSLETMAGSLETNVGTLTERANTTLSSFESMAGSIDREVTLTAEDARELISSLQVTAENLTSASNQLEIMIAENREPIRDFANSGLYELTNLLTEARDLVVVLNRVTTEVQRDPARFIFGDQQQGYEAQQ